MVRLRARDSGVHLLCTRVWLEFRQHNNQRADNLYEPMGVADVDDGLERARTRVARGHSG